MLEVLEADFSRIPELIGRTPAAVAPPSATGGAPVAPAAAPAPPEHPVQLGLF
jgi:hypothetical protein